MKVDVVLENPQVHIILENEKEIAAMELLLEYAEEELDIRQPVAIEIHQKLLGIIRELTEFTNK